MNHPRGDLQKLQPDGIDPEILHLLRECQPPEPIEQVVGKRVDLKAVRVHHFALAAHRAEIEPALALLDEVLHGPALAVEPDPHLGRNIHVCDDESVHQGHLSGRLLHFAEYSAGVIPAARLIQELSIADGIGDGILPHDPDQLAVKVRRFMAKDAVLLQADGIRHAVRLALRIQVRCGEAAVAAEKQRDIRVILLELIEERLKELHDTGTGIIGPVPELRFQEIAGHPVIADQRMIAVRLIVIVEGFPFLMAVSVQERGIEIKKEELRLPDAADDLPHGAADRGELAQRVLIAPIDEPRQCWLRG